MPVITPQTMNPAWYPHTSTMSPTTSGPEIAPRSMAIWKFASTLPPWRSEPMTSASTACCTGLSMPAPNPATADTASSATSPCMNPTTAVATPLMARPTKIRGRRPMRSDSDPENCSAMTLPTANAVSARPATAAPCSKVAAA